MMGVKLLLKMITTYSFSGLTSGCIYILNYPRQLYWLATPAIVAPRSFRFISFSKYKSRMTLAYFSILCLTVNHLIFRRCILITFIGLNILRVGCCWPVDISLKSTKVILQVSWNLSSRKKKYIMGTMRNSNYLVGTPEQIAFVQDQ